MEDVVHVTVRPEAASAVSCYHCGDTCGKEVVQLEEKSFCCEGCKTVYELLSSNDLCDFYAIQQSAGISFKRAKNAPAFEYLDDATVREQLIDFASESETRVTFSLPQMHCASCVWLLEHLYKLHPGVHRSKVNFLRREVYIAFEETQISLREVAEMLASIGYEPAINLGKLENKTADPVNRTFYYQLGVAGFAFGNIMLLSFPEYLGLEKTSDYAFFRLFGFINIALALPVVFFSGRDYLRSAWTGLRQGNLNMDVPIALGMLVLLLRSTYEVISSTGAGFFDSLAGLVLFLLAGKWFQQKTYFHLSFDRNYKSYFPVAALVKKDGAEKTVPLDQLEAGDTVIIRHQELIPADGILVKGAGSVDYSFVTGEALPVARSSGERVYAGGRQTGETIEVTLTKKVSQSYLTQLWNDEAFRDEKHSDPFASRIADQAGKYFTYAILLIAAVTALYWWPRDVSVAVNAATAVLMIACPCALALTVPFTLGNAMRMLARIGFYVKNTQVLERIRDVKEIVFDKTGTLTQTNQSDIIFNGAPLTFREMAAVKALVRNSNHPASRQIDTWLDQEGVVSEVTAAGFQEITGKGISGTVSGQLILLGSREWVGVDVQTHEPGVYVAVDGKSRGYFQLQNHYRPGMWALLKRMIQSFKIALLSGDSDQEQATLQPVFGQHLYFQQSPQDKLNYIRGRQAAGQTVMMIGDGLNDAGALQASDVGLVVTEQTNNFTPACDAILAAPLLPQLDHLVLFVRRSVRLVFAGYALALAYNVVGLSFAAMGQLSPVVAAILMPVSSVSVVLFAFGSSTLLAHRMGLNAKEDDKSQYTT